MIKILTGNWMRAFLMLCLLMSAFVANSAPTVSITSPSAGDTLAQHVDISITANVTRDPGTTVSKVEFFEGTSRISSDSTEPYAVSWKVGTLGSRTLTAKVTDSLGQVATSAPVVVNVVVPPDISSVITITNSQVNYYVGSSINIKAKINNNGATDFNKLEFFANSVLIGTLTPSGPGDYIFTWMPLVVGTYQITAKVTAYNLITDTSDNKTLNVTGDRYVAITSPLTGTVINPSAAFQVNANVTSPPGVTISKVDFYSDYNLGGTDTASPYTYLMSPLMQTGPHLIKAITTDSNGNTNESAPITVIADEAPTLSLTTSATSNTGDVYSSSPFPLGSNVTLNANLNKGNGSPTTKLEFFEGNTLIASITPNGNGLYSTSWSAANAGTFNISAKATSTYGLVTTTSNTIVINPTLVTFTAPANNSVFAASTSIVLSASATAAPGNTISKVEFFQGSSLLGTATALPYSISWALPAVNGTYPVTAKVTDSVGQTATNVINVIVDIPPTVVFSSPASGQVIPKNTIVTLTADAAPSNGRTISSVEFIDNGGATIGTDTTAPYSVQWTTPGSNGTQVLKARVTDNLGITSESTVNVTIDTPPVVSITSPSNNTLIGQGDSLTITANAVEGTGGAAISKVDFYQGSTLLGTDASPPYSFVWNNVAIGNYTLTAVATDSLGVTNTSSPVSIVANVNTYFIQTDHLNSPRLITDQNNNVVWRWDNDDPFGNNPANEDPDQNGQTFTNNLRLPGQYYDQETNLNYNYFRDYNPATGRYIESDPIGLNGGINTYAYVEGNPLMYSDPSGESITYLGITVTGLAIWGAYKIYSSFEKQVLCEKECKIQCENIVACGDTERTDMYQNNIPRCRNTCVPQCILGSSPKKGPTGPKAPKTTPKFWEE